MGIVITKQPEDQTTHVGGGAIFTVEATGNISGYEWQVFVEAAGVGSWHDIKDVEHVSVKVPVLNAILIGHSSATFRVSAINRSGVGKLRCRVYGEDEQISNEVTLTVMASNTRVKTSVGWKVGMVRGSSLTGVKSAKYVRVKTKTGWK